MSISYRRIFPNDPDPGGTLGVGEGSLARGGGEGSLTCKDGNRDQIDLFLQNAYRRGCVLGGRPVLVELRKSPAFPEPVDSTAASKFKMQISIDLKNSFILQM